MSGLVGWGLIAAAAVASMHFQKAPVGNLAVSPSQENEIDVLRWRHDGSQPISYKDGNRAGFVDPAAQRLLHEGGIAAFTQGL
tara:strand:- start:62 stop:310 length:249 start_codon:yes stop_codon:yes gene_type:complete